MESLLLPSVISPFMYDGKSYMNLSEYKDMIDYNVIDAMFKANPYLLTTKFSPPGNDIISSYLSKVNVIEISEKKINEIWRNLIRYLNSFGYMYDQEMRPLSVEMFQDDTSYTIYSDEGKHAILDIYTTPPKDVLKKISMTKGYLPLDSEYFLISKLQGKALTDFRNLENQYSLDKDIRIILLDPLILSISPSTHMLSPVVEKIVDPEIIHHKHKYPKISSSDPLMTELAFKRGDVIKVNDFSVHYREVI